MLVRRVVEFCRYHITKYIVVKLTSRVYTELKWNLFIPRAQTVTDKIFTLIRELSGDNRVIKLSEVMEQCTSKGYKPDQVRIVVSTVQCTQK